MRVFLFAQAELEKKLYSKTKNSNARQEAEIILLDNIVSVYKTGLDTMIFVVGDASENELILTAVLDALYDSLSILLRDQLEKRLLLDNVDMLMLCMDELVRSYISLSFLHMRVCMCAACVHVFPALSFC